MADEELQKRLKLAEAEIKATLTKYELTLNASLEFSYNGITPVLKLIDTKGKPMQEETPVETTEVVETPVEATEPTPEVEAPVAEEAKAE